MHNANDTFILAHADKAVLKIQGLTVTGLDTRELEQSLTEKIGGVVRVIGVTGTSIDMDIYGLDDTAVLQDESGIIRAISLIPGVTATEVTTLASLEKITPVHIDHIPPRQGGCAKERWLTIS